MRHVAKTIMWGLGVGCVAATIGVAEAAFMMRNMFEFSPQYLFAVFFIMAAGFVILTLPLGLVFTWLSNRLVVVR